jgi:hypothetical protein
MNVKKISIGLCLTGLLFLSACATSRPPGPLSWNLDTPLVSLSEPAPKETLTSMGLVTANFCVENGNILTRMGMMNEATKKALSRKPGAKYLSNAKFVNKGESCVDVSGTAMK